MLPADRQRRGAPVFSKTLVGIKDSFLGSLKEEINLYEQKARERERETESAKYSKKETSIQARKYIDRHIETRKKSYTHTHTH